MECRIWRWPHLLQLFDTPTVSKKEQLITTGSAGLTNSQLQCLQDLTNSVLTNHPGLTNQLLTPNIFYCIKDFGFSEFPGLTNNWLGPNRFVKSGRHCIS